jgi:uncharacterized protein YcbX
MKLDAIYVHPIKSCAGVSVPSATLDARGLVHDRRYMIVDEHDRFVTLRTEPRLALVALAIEPDAYVVSVPGEAPLRIPHELTLADITSDVGAGEPVARRVTVWNDTVDAIAHPGASALFTRYLGRPARLVHMQGATQRPVNPARGLPTDRLAFTDAFPLLLVARESVDDLSAHVGASMAIERFRPNLVIRGGAAYDEDRFAEIRIGDVSLRGPKACDRCVATTVDPLTASTSREPMATLARVRRANGKVWFGMNLIHSETGRLRVDDHVDVIRLHDAPAFG